MKLCKLVTVALLGSVSAVPLETRSDFMSDDLLVAGRYALEQNIKKNGPTNPKCTLKNAAVRKEW
jgi:hypothetical protein